MNSVLVDEAEDALRIHEKPRGVPGSMQRWEEVGHQSLLPLGNAPGFGQLSAAISPVVVAVDPGCRTKELLRPRQLSDAFA